MPAALQAADPAATATVRYSYSVLLSAGLVP